MIEMKNVAIFAGYDVLAFQSRDHIQYIKSAFQWAVKIGVGYIILIGGATNPHYLTLTEAEANKMIMDTCLSKTGLQPKIIVLPVGNTATEGLLAAKNWIIENLKSVNILLLCGEQSRIVNFQMDALQIGLLDLSETIMAYGHHFPESKENFSQERRKAKLHCFSHLHWFWKKIRLILQKRHQKKMARRK